MPITMGQTAIYYDYVQVDILYIRQTFETSHDMYLSSLMDGVTAVALLGF